jgi:hypothetical protein
MVDLSTVYKRIRKKAVDMNQFRKATCGQEMYAKTVGVKAAESG